MSVEIQYQARIADLTSNRWRMSADGKALEANLHFPTFKKTWEFMGLVAAKATEQRHHPEWANVYNKVFIRWTTHKVGGITEEDVKMAEACEKYARSSGASEELAVGSEANVFEELVKQSLVKDR